jgi:hypothetical protein
MKRRVISLLGNDEDRRFENNLLLGRREFNGLCAALGSSLPVVSAMIAGLSSAWALAAATSAASDGAGRTVKFHDGTIVPALGQGSWHLPQGRHPEAVEEEAPPRISGLQSASQSRDGKQLLDTSTPSGCAILQMMGVCQFERAIIRERVLSGGRPRKGAAQHLAACA